MAIRTRLSNTGTLTLSDIGAVYFDNDGDTLTLPLSSQFAIAANQDFTLECWAYLRSSTTNTSYMVDFSDSSNNPLQIRIGNSTDNYRVQGVFGTTGTGALSQITTAIAAGTTPYGVAVDPTGRFVYVANINSSTVSQYSINQTTGALTQITTAITSGSNNRGVAVDPTGRFVYVTNASSNSVSQYSINSSTGVLTQITTAIAAGTSSNGIATDSTGRFVYVTNFAGNTVSQYSINQTTGALTQITTAIASGSVPIGVAADPTGRFVYVTNRNSNTVSQYLINQTTGALTQITTAIAAGTSPHGVAADPTGRFVYVANNGSSTVSQYSINQTTGALTQITTAIAAGTGPYGVAADPTGRFVYVANRFADTVSQYSINQTTGALTQTTTAIAAGTTPYRVAVDPTGRFVYVSNGDANTVSQYSIDTNLAKYENASYTQANLLNSWSHLALSRVGTDTRFFFDGINIASRSATGNATIGTPTVARLGRPNPEQFYGYLSNVRFVKGTGLYSGNFTPSTTPLTATANTVLLTAQSLAIQDKSSNNFPLTLIGNPSPTDFSPFTPQLVENVFEFGSTYFDGTAALNFPTISVPASTSFCCEAWIYRPTLGTHVVFGGPNDLVGDGNNVQLTVFADGTIGGYAGGNWAGGGSGDNLAIAATWVHVAWARENTTSRVFINGALVGALGHSSGANITYIGALGRAAGALQKLYSGYISNARIVVGSPVYTDNFTPPTSALTAITNTSLLIAKSSSIIDNSSNNFSITSTAATVSSVNPFSSGSDYSISFNGTSASLTIPANSAFQFTGNYTIEFWVYFNSVAGVQDLVGNYVNNAAPDWTILLNGSVIQYYPSSGMTWVASPTLVVNTWYHVAAVRNGTTVSLYLNGTSVGTPLTFSGTLGDATRSVYVGARTGTTNYINGYISNLRIVKGTSVYTRNFTPSINLTNVLNTVLLLKFTTSALRLKDNSVNNFAITPVGNAAYSFFGPKPTTSSFSTYFDGSGDYLTVPTNAAFSFGTGDFTIECWVYLNTKTGLPVFAMLGDGIDATPIQRLCAWSLYFDGGANQLVFARYTPTYVGPTFSWNPSLNQWYHVCVTRSGTSLRAFVDGTQIGTTQTTSQDYSSVNSTDLHVGRFIASGGVSYFLNGYISNLRIVKGTAVYTSNFAPRTLPLSAIANTVLLTCRDKTIRDASTNNFTITKNGNTNWSSLTPFTDFSTYQLTESGINLNTIDEATLTSGSLYFDGTGDYLGISSSPAVAFGTGDFTVECWVYFSTKGRGVFHVATAGILPGTVSGIAVSTDGTNGWNLYWSGTQFTSATPTAINTWYHIAVTRSGTTLRLFINGVIDQTQTDSSNYTGTFGAIGGFYTTAYLIVGYITNFRIVKGSALYIGNFTPSAAILDPITNTSLLLNCLVNEEFKDFSTNNFLLTRNGNVGFSTFSPFYQNKSGSLYFDGTGDYLSVPDSAVMELGSNNFTVEAWINQPNVSGVQAILAKWGNPGYAFYFYTVSGNITFAINNSYYASNTNGLLSANTWNHVAMVRSGNTWALYLNGSQVYTATNAITINNDTIPWHVGVNPDGFTQIFTGYISNLRVVNGRALYTGNFTPSRSVLTAVPNTALLLNTASAATDIIDSSPNNFTVTRVGNTVFSNLTPVSNLPAQTLFPNSTMMIRYYDECTEPPFVPVADFIASSLLGAPPLTVTFTDRSSNVPTSWAWDFTNDGSTDSTSRNTSTTYSSTGTYSVRLTATNAAGSNTLIKTSYITVISPPVVNFTASPTSGQVPLTVNFTDQSTNSPTSWAWDFDNNGSTDSTSQNPSRTYNSAGTYSVKLTATNASGSGTLTKTSYITVSLPAPAASFTANVTSGNAPLTVTFTDQSTNSPTAWAWDFDNNGSTDSTSQNPSTTYSLPGTYSVKLTATNAGGSGTLTRTSYITVSPAATDAVYTSPGTYSWVAPAGVTSVCVVCVGGGGGGGYTGNYTNGQGAGSGGGGGGLRYQNSIAVTPGQSYTVVVGSGGGAGGAGTSSSFAGSIYGYGGGGGSIGVPNQAGGTGGGGSGAGGGNGGNGGSYRRTDNDAGSGGGGAGGYTGNGGAGGNSSTNNDYTTSSNGTAGSGGGGGGGGGGTFYVGGNGGGIGLYGAGASGAGGMRAIENGSQAGAAGAGGSGGSAGGIGAGSGGGGGEFLADAGGNGAVRIIWGAGRSFPNNAA